MIEIKAKTWCLGRESNPHGSKPVVDLRGRWILFVNQGIGG